MSLYRVFFRDVLLLAGTLAAAVCGCGGSGGPERVVVSGTVTYDGAPIPDGMIRFVPPETSHAPTAGAPIHNGSYKADGLGGVPVGTQKVQVEAFRNDKSVALRFPEVGARVQYLPDKYNAKTQLDITVPPGSRAIVKDFELAK